MATAASSSERFERVQALRIAPHPQAAQAGWKDWYHFVLLHPASGWRAIANINLAAGAGRAELQFTLVIHAPGQPPQAHGCSRSVPWQAGMVSASPLAICSDEVELRLQGHTWQLRMAPRGLNLALRLHAQAASSALLVTEASPLGSGAPPGGGGFIGWGLVPRLHVSGELRAGAHRAEITPEWFCYQDHNFGRFHWGDDFGWEWMVAHALPADAPADATSDAPASATTDAQPITVVLDRRTDRAHRLGGLAYLFVVVGGELRKVFLGPALALRWQWSEQASLPPRLPGAMATLLGDCTERRPTALAVDAADERDELQLRLRADAHVQLLTPEMTRPGFGCIGESSGPVTLAMRLGGRKVSASGLAYAEYTR